VADSNQIFAILMSEPFAVTWSSLSAHAKFSFYHSRVYSPTSQTIRGRSSGLVNWNCNWKFLRENMTRGRKTKTFPWPEMV